MIVLSRTTKYSNLSKIERGFITVNVSKIHFVKKKNISANKILAYLETIVKWFGETKWFKNVWRKKLDRIIEKLESTEK